jgi:mannose-6-phosphate isomerase-like protein (cupin superfamily)
VRRVLRIAVVGALSWPLMVSARAQAPASPSFGSKVLVDNDRVRIMRLSVPVGFRDPVSVTPNDQIAIQATPGEMEIVINGQKTVGHVDPGTVFYVPKSTPHQFSNAGQTAYDTIVVMLK